MMMVTHHVLLYCRIAYLCFLSPAQRMHNLGTVLARPWRSQVTRQRPGRYRHGRDRADPAGSCSCYAGHTYGQC
jgi:hypothetical protein